ncbi:MAG: TRAP transporter substrate-binding protein [Desulfobacterales bacterium]|nr:TRAP transporter substrate-binding protein [Desulfobacterales bacterium]
MSWKKLGFAFLILFFVCGTLITVGQQPAMAKEMKLIIASYITPSYKDLFTPTKIFADYINEHGKGKVRLEYFHSGTLLKAEELLPGLMQGTADMIFHTDSYIMGTLPILGIIELPFLYESMEDASKKLRIGSPLYELINQELAKKNLFMVATLPAISQYIWTKDKPVRKPEDLKGLRIRTAGRVEAMVIKALGGASTTIPTAELYEALQRGTVDGALCYWGTIPARGLQEVLKYYTKGYFAAYTEEIYMPLDKWKGLPPDIRKLMIESAKLYEKQIFEYAVPVWDKETWPVIKKAGLKETELTREERAKFREMVKPVWDWWKDQLPPGVGEKAIKLATE